MLQFASQRPGKGSRISNAKVTYNDKTDQYMLHLEGAYSEIFPKRVELFIEGDWLMIRPNYNEGYRMNGGNIQVTATDEAHRKAIDRFVGHEWNRMGYNRDLKMFGFKLPNSEERQISLLFPQNNEEWKDYSRIDKDNSREPARWEALNKKLDRLLKQNRIKDAFETVIQICKETGGEDDE